QLRFIGDPFDAHYAPFTRLDHEAWLVCRFADRLLRELQPARLCGVRQRFAWLRTLLFVDALPFHPGQYARLYAGAITRAYKGEDFDLLFRFILERKIIVA